MRLNFIQLLPMTTTSVDVAINLSALVGAVCLALYQRDFVWRFSVRQLLLLTTATSFLLKVLTG
jgi:hypothetical protein